MTSDTMRAKLDLYRRWFKTLLVKEYLNLPSKYQERFLTIAEKFLQDCRRVFEEHKQIMERSVIVTVTSIEKGQSGYMVTGELEEAKGEVVKLLLPSEAHKGSKIRHTLYSFDGETWHSSKEKLVTGRS